MGMHTSTGFSQSDHRAKPRDSSKQAARRNHFNAIKADDWWSTKQQVKKMVLKRESVMKISHSSPLPPFNAC